MESRRYILFIVLSISMFVIYTNFILPKMLPPPPAAEEVEEEDDGKDKNQKSAGIEAGPVVAPRPDERDKQVELPRHPKANVTLGSLDPESGYFLEVELRSKGATLASAKLNDPKFRDLDDKNLPLALIGHEKGAKVQTLMMGVSKLDELLKEEIGEDLTQVNWELVKTTNDPDNGDITTEAVYAWEFAPAGLRVVKRFAVPKVEDTSADARKTQVAGYLIEFDLTIENLTEEEQELSYTLVGPVATRLENRENTRKYRDLRVGILDEDQEVSDNTVAASTLIGEEADGEVEIFRDPFAYIGVDNQYFAALLHPEGNQVKDRYFESARPFVVEKDNEEEAYSDLSVRMTSEELKLPANGSVTHEFEFYAGPKRQDLLAPLKAEAVLDYGFFGMIAKVMLWVLNGLYLVLRNYGLAIIGLTVLVRSLMYPLSRKQVQNAEKMKELQPEIKALQERYKNNKEKLAQAQMELFRKNKYNPFAGCLPIFMQLPIFFGLYSALYASVDLRMASFLWIDNLAAPDQLFKLPFKLPFLGTWFNLLPLLTIVLFIVQQKMFMPTPDTPEGKMQMKVMNFMMIFMGFLFYKVPAGLCLYFIASSLWGIAERKLLRKPTAATSEGNDASDAAPVVVDAARGTRVRRSDSKRNRR